MNTKSNSINHLLRTAGLAVLLALTTTVTGQDLRALFAPYDRQIEQVEETAKQAEQSAREAGGNGSSAIALRQTAAEARQFAAALRRERDQVLQQGAPVAPAPVPQTDPAPTPPPAPAGALPPVQSAADHLRAYCEQLPGTWEWNLQPAADVQEFQRRNGLIAQTPIDLTGDSPAEIAARERNSVHPITVHYEFKADGTGSGTIWRNNKVANSTFTFTWKPAQIEALGATGVRLTLAYGERAVQGKTEHTEPPEAMLVDFYGADKDVAGITFLWSGRIGNFVTPVRYCRRVTAAKQKS